MDTPTSPPAESALYRRVWRWHFYAGLVCLPLLALMALTGALYLYKGPIEALLYARLWQVPATASPALSAQALVARAQAAMSGDVVRYVAPATPGRSAEVGVRTAQGVVAVYLHPAQGQVLGTLHDDQRLMDTVRRLHSLALAGSVANHAVEVVAGWSIVLVVSGVCLWWPRGRRGGVRSVRGRPAQRVWWRDLHALTGVVASVAIVFLAVTGMPWSAFWGEQFGRLTSRLGVGVPQHVWGPGPASTLPALGGLPAVPWGLGQVPVPMSPALQQEQDQEAASIGLDQALQRFAQLGLPLGTPIRLPAGPQGVYSALHVADDVRDQRVLHLDRYTGAVLADLRFADYGAAARVAEWGISLHTGRQFGAVNQAVMLVGCLAVLGLAVSAVVMWWKRRPAGRLAAPPRRAGDRAALGALGVAALLGLLYPLLGATMVVAALLDAAVPAAWKRRYGL